MPRRTARQTQLWPGRFFGIASLPQCAGRPIERGLQKLGFVGTMINPTYENGAGEAPPMGDHYWYPLYEKLCELDMPKLVHATTSKSPRVIYSEHMINEETIAMLGLLNSDVFSDFPVLKLIIPHGGGSSRRAHVARRDLARLRQVRARPRPCNCITRT